MSSNDHTIESELADQLTEYGSDDTNTAVHTWLTELPGDAQLFEPAEENAAGQKDCKKRKASEMSQEDDRGVGPRCLLAKMFAHSPQ